MAKKGKKLKATSVLPLAATGGFLIGIGLGALMGNALVVMLIGVAVGCGIGYSVDRKNGITYGRKPH